MDIHAHPVRCVGIRDHLHLGDQLADQLRRLDLDLGIVECVGELGHLAGIDLGEIGHHGDYPVIGRLRCHLRFNLRLLALALDQAIQNRFWCLAGFDHVHHPLDGSLGISQPLRELGLSFGGVFTRGRQLALDLGHIRFDPIRLQQFVLEACENAVLNFLAGDGLAIGTHAGAAPVVGAAISVLAQDDVIAATARAFE
nr:hypothetical protein [Magnetospirillum sp. XM-1]